MNKTIIFIIILIFLSSITGGKDKSYSGSMYPYCGASRHVEGDKITNYPAIFPSESPPEHMHFYITLSGSNGNNITSNNISQTLK